VNRIKQMRLAKGLSLEALAREMGGLVTKQALSKYEKGLSKPSPTVASRLAAVLGVKTLHLWTSPSISVEFVAYRRLSKLGKKEQAKIEALVGKSLEDRCRIQDRLGLSDSFDWIEKGPQIRRLEEAESAAVVLRDKWNLGTDAISDLTSILENRLVHVMEFESAREFDGISAKARNEKGAILAAAVTTRKAISGDRQRMNLAHELGHLILRFKTGIDEEAMAFRFAGAFLLPAGTLRREIGERRTNLQLTELFALKRKFGISLQALLRRLSDLGIIAPTSYRSWMIEIGKKGWRKEEPEPIAPEKPTWLERMLTRALAEGVIAPTEVKNMGGPNADEIADIVPKNRAAFLRLPIKQRRRILEVQARQARKYYMTKSAENDLESGEIDDYESN
jgi:Zn-dependent peptidase ImmA (M78 family)/DNA-binding XRE family transcriptional regulator